MGIGNNTAGVIRNLPTGTNVEGTRRESASPDTTPVPAGHYRENQPQRSPAHDSIGEGHILRSMSRACDKAGEESNIFKGRPRLLSIIRARPQRHDSIWIAMPAFYSRDVRRVPWLDLYPRI